jgi:hypothetical protein
MLLRDPYRLAGQPVRALDHRRRIGQIAGQRHGRGDHGGPLHHLTAIRPVPVARPGEQQAGLGWLGGSWAGGLHGELVGTEEHSFRERLHALVRLVEDGGTQRGPPGRQPPAQRRPGPAQRRRRPIAHAQEQHRARAAPQLDH